MLFTLFLSLLAMDLRATASMIVTCRVGSCTDILLACFAVEKCRSSEDFLLCSTTMLHTVQNSFPPLSWRTLGNCFARSFAVIFVGKCDVFALMPAFSDKEVLLCENNAACSDGPNWLVEFALKSRWLDEIARPRINRVDWLNWRELARSQHREFLEGLVSIALCMTFFFFFFY